MARGTASIRLDITLDQLSWADFTAPWEHDVKAGLYWLQAALNQPLKPGSRVLVVSSGAAENGSPMSGGYGGAQRMLWFMAKYANGVSEKRRLGIRFQAIVPQQMVLGTGVGDAGANAYAHAMGMKPEEFVARFGAPMSPREFGEKVVSVLDDPGYAEGFAFGLRGDTGVTMLEVQRLEHRTAFAEPGPSGGASSLWPASCGPICTATARVSWDRSSTARTSCKIHSSGLSWRCRIWTSCRSFDPGCSGLLITARSTCYAVARCAWPNRSTPPRTSPTRRRPTPWRC